MRSLMCLLFNKLRYLVFGSETTVKQIEDAFKEFTVREDIAIVLISQYVNLLSFLCSLPCILRHWKIACAINDGMFHSRLPIWYDFWWTAIANQSQQSWRSHRRIIHMILHTTLFFQEWSTSSQLNRWPPPDTRTLVKID